MKLKELLDKIYAGDTCTEISIQDNDGLIVEDVQIFNLALGLYKNLKHREIKEITAAATSCIYIKLEPDQ